MVWLGAFSSDPSVIAVGSVYLHTVGPFFGLFGMGYGLYCAGQGTGRMGWPATGALVRGHRRHGRRAGAARRGRLDGSFLRREWAWRPSAA